MKHNISYKFLFKIILIAFILIYNFSCEKDEIKPQSLFETKINEADKKLSPSKAIIDKGIISISAFQVKQNIKSALVITVKGDKESLYEQEYDYKTGVSITQCGLTYKIFSRTPNIEPEYYVSYEGFVKITSIDGKRNTISGEYEFRVRSIPDKNNTKQVIKGSFVDIPLK